MTRLGEQSQLTGCLVRDAAFIKTFSAISDTRVVTRRRPEPDNDAPRSCHCESGLPCLKIRIIALLYPNHYVRQQRGTIIIWGHMADVWGATAGVPPMIDEKE